MLRRLRQISGAHYNVYLRSLRRLEAAHARALKKADKLPPNERAAALKKANAAQKKARAAAEERWGKQRERNISKFLTRVLKLRGEHKRVAQQDESVKKPAETKKSAEKKRD